MTLIGMLHHRKDPSKVKRAYAYSVVAKAEGVEFFYFTPAKVDIINQTIIGNIMKMVNGLTRNIHFQTSFIMRVIP